MENRIQDQAWSILVVGYAIWIVQRPFDLYASHESHFAFSYWQVCRCVF